MRYQKIHTPTLIFVNVKLMYVCTYAVFKSVSNYSPGNAGSLCIVVISKASIFFTRMELVSHLLSTACRESIAQWQTAVSGRGKAAWWDANREEASGSTKQQERQLDMCMSGEWALRQRAGTRCLCVSLFALWLRSSRWITEALPTETRELLNASTHRASHSNNVISSSDDFWYVVFFCLVSLRRARLNLRVCRKINVENTSCFGSDWARSLRGKRSLWI